MSRETINPKNKLTYRIVNYNGLIYKASIDDSLITYESKPSQLFQALFSGDSTILTEAINKMRSTITVQGTNGNTQSTSTVFCEYQCFLKKINHLKGTVEHLYDKCPNLPNVCNHKSFDYTSLLEDLRKLKESFALISLDSIELINSELEIQKIKLRACSEAYLKFDTAQTQFETLLNSPNDNSLFYQSQAFEYYEKKLATYKSKLCQDESKISEKKANLDTRKKKLQYLNSLRAALIKEEDLTKIIRLINSVDESTFEYKKNIYDLRGNLLKLHVNISDINDDKSSNVKVPQATTSNNDAEPKADKDNKKQDTPIEKKATESFYITQAIVWKPFISFSTGAFTTMQNKLQSTTYDWVVVPNSQNTVQNGDNKYKLAQNGYSAPVFGLSEIANLNWMISSSIGIALSTGVGITIEKKPRFGYLFGGSITLGQQQQYVLTAGKMLMPKDKLVNSLNSYDTAGTTFVSEDKSSLPEISYYKELKSDCFFSITFNLSDIKKTKKKKIDHE